MYITELNEYSYNHVTNSIVPNTLANMNTPSITISTESVLIPDNDGINVAITTTTTHNAINSYDYEVSTNEDKRSINLIKPEYAGLIENEFGTLLT